MHVAGMERHERLKWARERRGFRSAADAARYLGAPYGTYSGHENGGRGIKDDELERYAKAFKVPLAWLAFGEGPPPKELPRTAMAVGYVGAGAEIIPIDDHEPGTGLEEVEIPPGVPADAVLVIVRGDSMYPRYFDGEYLFYVRRDRDPAELIGRECVVKLRDGRMFVKVLRKSPVRNRLNLESWNAPIMEDQAVEWAAPVLARVNRMTAA